MAIAVALLVSNDPVTIQQFSYSLQELSISLDVPQTQSASLRIIRLTSPGSPFSKLSLCSTSVEEPARASLKSLRLS
jgi:hypothetical protein